MDNVTPSKATPVKVWDFSIRLFHWSLACLIGFLWWSGTEGEMMDKHVQAGYAILALISYRLIWGFIGSHHARFVHFIHSPIATLKAIPDLFSVRSDSHYVGHNPLGGWMVILLLFTLLLQAISGLGTTDDISIDGPLIPYLSEEWASRLGEIHVLLPDFLVALILLHLGAVLFHDAVKRERLIQAMITGVKQGKDNSPHSVLPTKRFIAVVTVLSIISWWLLSRFVGF